MLKRLFIISFIFASSITAQSVKDSLSFLFSNYSNQVFSTSYEKNLNTYNLANNFVVNHSVSKFNFGLQGLYNTTFFNSSASHIKEERLVDAIAEFEFNNILKGGFAINSNVYSNDRQLSINEASLHNGAFYINYNPLKELFLIPFGGISINQQTNERDDGFVYGSEIMLNNFNLDENRLDARFEFKNEDISPRKHYVRNLFVGLKSNFVEDFSNHLIGSYSEQRRDFYFAADENTANAFNITNNIQSRTELIYKVSDRMKFGNRTDNFWLDFTGDFQLRDIERATRYRLFDEVTSSSFDTKIRELKILFLGSAYYNLSFVSGFFRSALSERNETHNAKPIENANPIFLLDREEQEKQKNSQAKQITISSVNNFSITDSDALIFSLLHKKLVYDTPSDNNFDDRDELLTILKLGYNHKFNSFFNYFLNLDGSYNHLVYIFSERSSDNNSHKFLRLSGGGNYSGEKFKMRSSAEVSANYVVYDFENINPNLNSYTYRQFVLRDSLGININRLTNFEFNGYFKLSEQGEFFVADFSANPQRLIEEIYIVPKFVYNYRNATIGVGLRYFSLVTFSFRENFIRQRDKQYKSIGPLVDLKINIREKLSLVLFGYYEFIETEDLNKREMANLRFQMNWNF